MNKKIANIYDLIQELSWYFGNQGFSGKCCGNLSLVEFTALKHLSIKNIASVQEIGVSLNISKSGASKIIDRLEADGLVLREKSTVDGRVCCVAITKEGVNMASKITDTYSSYVNEALRDLEPVSIENIESSLAILTDSIRKKGFIKPTAM